MTSLTPTIDDLPVCLQPFAQNHQTDEVDDLIVIYTLIGALSSVAGHLADECSEYHAGVKAYNPITVNHIIIADSGSGKSRLCRKIFADINKYIDNQTPAYDKAMKEFNVLLRGINSSNITVKNGGFESADILIPDEPISPNFFIEDFTIESLSRSYKIGAHHLTVYSEEGGNVISSRAFAVNSINTTLSFFNKIMCGDRAIVNTVKDGQRVLVNKRITLLLLMQDSFFNDFTTKASTQACAGTYQRIVPIRAENKRKIVAEKKAVEISIIPDEMLLLSKKMLVDFCKQIVRTDNNRLLDPIKISKTKEAHEIWYEYFRDQNDYCALNKKCETVSYRLRNVELASRYAALFQLGDNMYSKRNLSSSVIKSNMVKAIKFARYGLSRQMQEFIYNDNDLIKSRKTLNYIINARKIVSRITLMQNLPRDCRGAKNVDNSILFLIEEGYLEKVPNGFIYTGKKEK